MHRCPRCAFEFESDGYVPEDQLALIEVPEGQEVLPVLPEATTKGPTPPEGVDGTPVAAESTDEDLAQGDGERQLGTQRESGSKPVAESSPLPAAAGAEAISAGAGTLHVQERLDVTHAKPQYRIPLVAEIREWPTNGLTVVSTFSGCGGSCLGFKMAGFEALMASEFIPAAVDTYAANFPDVPIAVGDVRDLEPALVMERLGLVRGELDVLEGSPPCSSFSTAGKRDKSWAGMRCDQCRKSPPDARLKVGDPSPCGCGGKLEELVPEAKPYSDTKQRTDDLFDEWIRLVDGFLPRVCVAENVAGFLYGAADDVRQWVEGKLTELGYIVWTKKLDAAQLGVPQHRRRAILIGVRRDVGTHPSEMFPSLLPYTYSVRDAIGRQVGINHDSRGQPQWSHGEIDTADPLPTLTYAKGGAITHWQVEGEGDPDLTSLPGVDEQTVIEHDLSSARSLGEVDLDGPLPSPVLAQRGKSTWKISEGEEEPQPGDIVGVSNSGHSRRPVIKDPAEAPAPTIQTSPRGDEAGSGWVYELGTPEEIAYTSLESRKDKPEEKYTISDAWDEVEQGGVPHEKYFSLVKPDVDQPSPTVTQTGGNLGAASVVHPTQKRKFTIPELRRLCGFPDDFVLTGTYRQQWERLGRAVPPPMMYAIASKIRDALLKADSDLDATYGSED